MQIKVDERWSMLALCVYYGNISICKYNRLISVFLVICNIIRNNAIFLWNSKNNAN